MPANPKRQATRELGRMIVGGVILIAYFVLVEVMVGWRALLAQCAHVGAAPLLLVLGGLTGGYALRALRLKQVLAAPLEPASAEPVGAVRDVSAFADVSVPPAPTAMPAPGFATLLRCLLLNNAANWLLPARAGDLGLPLLLRREAGLSRAHGVSVLLWLRLLDLHALAGIGGATFALTTTGIARLAGIGALLGAMVAPWLSRRVLAQLAPRLARRFPRIKDALALLDRTPAALRRDIALTWTAWLVKLIALGFALAQLSGATPGAGLAGAIGGDLSTVLPIHAPLGAGTFESGVLLAMTPWGLPAPGLIAAAVQFHLLMLAVALAATGASLLIPSRPPALLESQ